MINQNGRLFVINYCQRRDFKKIFEKIQNNSSIFSWIMIKYKYKKKSCDIMEILSKEEKMDIIKHLQKSEEDIENGNTTPASEFFTELREEYGIY